LARVRWLAWLVLCLAAGLRLCALGFDLDLADPERVLLDNHTDARSMLTSVQAALRHGDLDPRNFLLRGPAGFLAFGAADELAVVALSAEHPRGHAGVLAELERNPSLLMLLHRCVAACAGIATVFVLLRLVRREFDTPSALCAGAFLAVAYLHVRDSHLGTVETLWGLAVVLALDACFRLLAEPSARRHALAGLLIGMAVAVKYFSVVLVPVLVLAHGLARAEAAAAGRTRPRASALVLGLGALPAGFLLLFPGFFLGSAGGLLESVRLGTEVMAPKPDLGAVLELLAFHAQASLAVGLGEPVLLLALGGLFVAWRLGRRGRLLVLAVLCLLPTLVLTHALLVRYGMSLLVVLTIPAGLAMGALLGRVPRALGAVALGLALAPSLLRSMALDRVWLHADTRVQLLGELRARCRPGERVLAVGLHADQPRPLLPQAFEYVNYLLATSTHRVTLAGVLAEPPRWIVWGQRLASEDIPDGLALEALVRAQYRAVASFGRPCAESDVSPMVVPRALEVPYARPWTVERPGPPMRLYERVD